MKRKLFTRTERERISRDVDSVILRKMKVCIPSDWCRLAGADAAMVDDMLLRLRTRRIERDGEEVYRLMGRLLRNKRLDLIKELVTKKDIGYLSDFELGRANLETWLLLHWDAPVPEYPDVRHYQLTAEAIAEAAQLHSNIHASSAAWEKARQRLGLHAVRHDKWELVRALVGKGKKLHIRPTRTAQNAMLHSRQRTFLPSRQCA